MLPKGLGNLGNMAGMLKQAMEMKSKMEAMKDSLANETVEASAGGGMVKVVVNGKCKLVSISIDPEIVNKEETEMLETMIQAAINEGVDRVQDLIRQRMTELTGGIDIPGLTS
ncbi:MAG TPA: YbaB/EbfC family nucleoid-associated protein [Candidatus Hydrogenedentes bacterium]|nr:YbaB/EbfC family nucleoid-associated protein [Candidatus Hydrogenedentota bacterium]